MRTAAATLAALRRRSTARRAVQGDCAAPFQGGSGGPPVGDLAPRQCVISLSAGLVGLDDHAPGLWLDNLALRFTGTTAVLSLLRSFASSTADTSAGEGALWLTGVAVAGGGLAPGVRVVRPTLFASGALPSCARAAACRRAVQRPRAAEHCVAHTAEAPCSDVNTAAPARFGKRSRNPNHLIGSGAAHGQIP